ncbi:MAG: amino-acid N-acetyltransferase [Cardiobacteriaceae bacterium]|nr:amino-acid N-acetyltransferase [Cardiobacteriaceae bacterium]
MHTAEFLSFFYQAAPYIHAHRGKTFVIHFDADFADSYLENILQDCAILQSLGIKLILIHGIRAEIDRNLAKGGIISHFSNDKRITSKEMIPEILNAAGSVRLKIEAVLSMNIVNSPMQDAEVKIAGGNYITARPLGVIGGCDFGYTGEIRKINEFAIKSALSDDEIVLISPIGYAPTGEIFNLDSEEVASTIAAELAADKLIYLCEGIANLRASERLHQLTPDLAKKKEVENSGIRRRMRAAASACEAGIARVHLVEKDNQGALLQELFTRDGAGIMITAELYDILRPATIDDINHIIALIRPLEANGTLIPRSREILEADIDKFYVLIRDGSIIACVALYPYVEEKTAELACLAVAPEYRKHRRADFLLEQLSQIARQKGMESLFLLTTQTAQWFEARGFSRIEIEELPEKKRAKYNRERNSRAYRKFL